jgi:hypothetical protein
VGRRLSTTAVFLVLAATGGPLVAAASTAEPPSRSSVSVSVTPASYVQGIYFFRVRIRGFAVETRHGTYSRSPDVLFVYPVQAKPCPRDVYTEAALQTDGQGYQYRVGPGAFSIELTSFAGSRLKRGHVCAYLAPVNFHVIDEGGVPLGPLAARTDLRINVREGV